MTTERDRRQRSYHAGARVSRHRMSQDAPEDHAALDAVQASDIVVVRGQYDRVEVVLDALELPHTTIGPRELTRIRLRPEQLLVIDCPGQIGRDAVTQVRDFVAAGGSLFTTDWALRHVLEPGFPGVVAFNERPTSDAVVRVEIAEHDNPFLQGVMEGDDDPLWWLEGSSYPIKVLDPSRVQVLIRSRELEEHWGEAPVAITFRHGDGEVLHMISHYYLQRTETRTRRHAAPAASYFAEKGYRPAPDVAAAAEDLSVSDIESAHSSARFMSNIVAQKKRAAREAERQSRSADDTPEEGSQ